jgi:hypothetical protein
LPLISQKAADRLIRLKLFHLEEMYLFLPQKQEALLPISRRAWLQELLSN